MVTLTTHKKLFFQRHVILRSTKERLEHFPSRFPIVNLKKTAIEKKNIGLL